jgi:hypothetical protein
MDKEQQQSHWDQKYEEGLPSLTTPDPFFLSAFSQFVAHQFPDGGVALDLAGGLGRHALWLASRKWEVSVVDISEVALQKLNQKATQLELELELFVGDAAEYGFELAHFDLIVCFYHIDRRLSPRIVSALKTDGILICKNRLNWGSEEDPTPSDTGPLGPNEILSLFPELQVVYHGERSVRGRGVLEYVGKKTK